MWQDEEGAYGDDDAANAVQLEKTSAHHEGGREDGQNLMAKLAQREARGCWNSCSVKRLDMCEKIDAKKSSRLEAAQRMEGPVHNQAADIVSRSGGTSSPAKAEAPSPGLLVPSKIRAPPIGKVAMLKRNYERVH